MDSADHHNYQRREALPRELCSFGAESKVHHFDSYILQEWFHECPLQMSVLWYW